MTDVLNLGWIAIAVIAIVAMLNASKRATQAAAAAKRWQASAEEIEHHTQAWQQRALEAEAELEAVRGSYATLQALYCEWVRKTLGTSVAIYKVEKE